MPKVRMTAKLTDVSTDISRINETSETFELDYDTLIAGTVTVTNGADETITVLGKLSSIKAIVAVRRAGSNGLLFFQFSSEFPLSPGISQFPVSEPWPTVMTQPFTLDQNIVVTVTNGDPVTVEYWIYGDAVRD